MPTARVVLTLDVGEQRQSRFGLGLSDLAIDELAFKAREEALGHRVVIDMAHRVHLLATCAKGDARLLAASLVLVNHLIGLALLQLHVPR